VSDEQTADERTATHPNICPECGQPLKQWVLPLKWVVGAATVALIALLAVIGTNLSLTGGRKNMPYTIVSWAPLSGVSDDNIASDLGEVLAARNIDSGLIRFTPGMALYPFDGPTDSIMSDMEAVVAGNEGLQLWYTVVRKGTTFSGWPGDDTDHLEAARPLMNTSGSSYPQILPRPATDGGP